MEIVGVGMLMISNDVAAFESVGNCYRVHLTPSLSTPPRRNKLFRICYTYQLDSISKRDEKLC